MKTLSHPSIIGIDVSRDWLDIHCLPDGQNLRLPNTTKGHRQLVALARARGVPGDHNWPKVPTVSCLVPGLRLAACFRHPGRQA